MPRPRPSRQFRAGLPAEPFGRELDHVDGARVGEMLEPEFDRIGAGRGGELVHEALDREHIGVGAEPAQRRDPQLRCGMKL